MYNFRNVNETSESIVLPSEALCFNGEYFENLIPGYRTLNVSGREALSPELTDFETGIRDGSTLKNKRYPSRTIIVTYQLKAETNEAFREAYNQLAYLLDCEDAELIFSDEPDKFFTGTPSAIGEVEPGRNSVVGDIEFICHDPFKYSVVEYEAVADLDESSVLIDYKGTYKSFPVLRATFPTEEDVSDDGESESELTGNGDCGYVAFFTSDEKIIQLGNPDEVDGVDNAYPKSQTLVNSTFQKSTAWGTAAKNQWVVNDGKVSSSAIEQVGTLGMGVATYAVPATPKNTSGTLFSGEADGGTPTFVYKVVAKATNRTETTVKVSVSITSALTRDTSYFGRGYGLKASLYIGGSWRSIVLKDTSAYWKGRSGHTVNFSCTISGLSATTSSLTGIQFKVERTDSTGGQSGVLSAKSCNNLTLSQYVDDVPETYYLTPTSYGSGSGYHGATITRTIPADAAGEVGAVNCCFGWTQKMSIGNSKNSEKEIGAFQVCLVSGSGDDRKIIAGINIFKNANGKKANVHYYVNGDIVQKRTISLAYGNKLLNGSTMYTISKFGHCITFNFAGKKSVHKDTDISDAAVTSVTLAMTAYGSRTPLTFNGLQRAKFIKNGCETYKDIPNKFSANDYVDADCRTAEIYLNGIEAPELGALGNDWEEFFLYPGLNQIGISYSDWVDSENAPSMSVFYREVFL